MKKIFALFLALIMMLSLCACGTTPDKSGSVNITPATEAPTTPPTVTPAFTEQAIVDKNDVKFILTSAAYEDGFWGQMIDVRLENNTTKNLMYSLDAVSINGYMVDVLFATEVAAGKKENTSITIFSTDLEKNKITSIENIEFTLRIYDWNDWEADDIVKETYKIEFTK